MGVKAIDDTFKYFTTPFIKANLARNDAIDFDSSIAARCARLYCLAQIVASIAAVPLLIVAGLFDALQCKANVLDIPKAVMTQLFLILPLSIIGAILPLSVSKKLDTCLGDRTLQNRINVLNTECLSSLQERLNRMLGARLRPTIEQSDLTQAIQRKTRALQIEAEQKDLETIEQELNLAELGTSLHADRYDILKIKQQNINAAANQPVLNLINLVKENVPNSVVYKDARESLAHKIAKNGRTIPQLREDLAMGIRLAGALNGEDREIILAEYPDAAPRESAILAMDWVYQIAILLAIGKKYIFENTLENLERRVPENAAEQAEIQQAIEKKRACIGQDALFKSLRVLQAHQQDRRALAQDPIFYQDSLDALELKYTQINQLATKPLEELQTLLANSRNPVRTSDVSEAILRYYCKNYNFEQLDLLVTQSPNNTLLVDAINRKTLTLDLIVREKTLEQLLENPPQPESAEEYNDRMEMIRRKYFITRTLDELWILHTAHPQDQNIEKALRRKQIIVQMLLDTKTLEELFQQRNREQDPSKRAELQIVCIKKQEQIDQLVNTKTRSELYQLRNGVPSDTISGANYRTAIHQKEAHIIAMAEAHTLAQLQNNEGVDPFSRIAMNDCEEAAQYKGQHIDRLANENTLEQLRANRAENGITSIEQNDLDFAIQRKVAAV